NALGGEADAAGKSVGSKLVDSLKKALAAAGIGKMLSDTIKEGARYEQARGGIETLFGAKGAKSVQEYADMVGKSVSQVQGEYTRLKGTETQMMKNANDAWKTAGISANEYMEQSTSFAASLLQSVGGNQQKAAEAANQAVIDMSDNANKFGTNIADIQHAYQGFAKQNYTMLDNLKLGYGGTKTEMERLLADAEEISGIHYDINNLDDVYKAIHVIQDELGVTGTTAKEAATTLSGSFASMKAAASNMMAQLVVGEDVKGAMEGLVESVVTFAKNLIPAIGRVFAALPGAIGTAIKAIHPELMNGLKNATDAVKKNLPGMIKNALTSLLNFSSTIRQNAGQLVDAGLEMIKSLAGGIIKSIPTIIRTVPTIISNFAGIINDNAPKILATGLSIIKSLALGLIKAIPVLIQELPKIIKAIWDVFTAFQWINLGKTIMTALKNGITALGGAMKQAGQSIVDGIKGVFANGWNAIKTTASSVWNAIKSLLTGNWNGIRATAASVWNAIKSAVTNPVQAARSALSGAWNAIKSAASSAFSGIRSIASSTWSGIKSAMTAPIEAAKTTIKSALNKIKGFFPLSVGKIFSNIKLPKISVSGGKAPYGIGGKGSLPSFSVSWHAQGGVYDSASIVGIGVGEAGREIITPEELMRQVFNESNEPVYEILERILRVAEAIAENDQTFVLNNREFARAVRGVV
ncbi:MAG: hypothetical protein IJ820_08140, partial [Lachnospiraceae bacterium]|nr:hypothetical protein [Lachnospiraceae bacterium]